MPIATKDTTHDLAHSDHAGHDHARHDHAGHDHAHGAHDHMSQDKKRNAHSHDHAHAKSAPSAPRRAHPGFSLLRMSSLQRLVLALALVVAIWLSVFWAWS